MMGDGVGLESCVKVRTSGFWCNFMEQNALFKIIMGFWDPTCYLPGLWFQRLWCLTLLTDHFSLILHPHPFHKYKRKKSHIAFVLSGCNIKRFFYSGADLGFFAVWMGSWFRALLLQVATSKCPSLENFKILIFGGRHHKRYWLPVDGSESFQLDSRWSDSGSLPVLSIVWSAV